jgi:hypothetical protein
MHVVLEVDIGAETVRERCDGPPGMWGSPPISEAAHLAKVRDCLARGLGHRDIERFLDLASRFDELPNSEVRQLIELAGRAPARNG